MTTKPIVVLGTRAFELGPMNYQNKKGETIKSFGLQEVQAVVDPTRPSVVASWKNVFQGVRLQAKDDAELRAFLERTLEALRAGPLP